MKYLVTIQRNMPFVFWATIKQLLLPSGFYFYTFCVSDLTNSNQTKELDNAGTALVLLCVYFVYLTSLTVVASATVS